MSWVLKHAFPVNSFSVYHVHDNDLFLANEDNTVRQWSIMNQKKLLDFKGHYGRVSAIQYCERYKLLFTTSMDGRFIVWGGGKMVRTYLNRQRKKDNFGSPFFSLCYCKKNGYVYVGSKSEILCFRLNYDEIIKSIEMNPEGLFGNIPELVPSFKFKIHTDIIDKLLVVDDKLISVSMDHSIGFSHLEVPNVNKIIYLNLRQAISSILYDQYNQVLLVGSIDGKIYTLSRDGLFIEVNDVFPGYGVVSMALDYKASLVWVVSANGDLKLLDMKDLSSDLTGYFDTLKEKPIVGLTKYNYFGVKFTDATQIMSVFLNEHYIFGFSFELYAAIVTLTLESPFLSLSLMHHSNEGFQYIGSKYVTGPESLQSGNYIFGGGKTKFMILKQENRFKFSTMKIINSESTITAIRSNSIYISFGDDKGNIYAIKKSTMENTQSSAPLIGSISSIHYNFGNIIATTLAGSWHVLSIATIQDPIEEVLCKEMAHSDSINDSAFCSIRSVLLTAGSEGLVKSWSVGSKQKHPGTGTSIFITDATTSLNEIGVYDMRAYGEVMAIRIAESANRVVTSHGDSQIRIWDFDLDIMPIMFTIPCGGCLITAIDIDDPEVILAALSDKTIRCFSLFDGKLRRTLIGHKDTICAVSYSTDFNYYASCAWDGSLKLWSRTEKTGLTKSSFIEQKKALLKNNVIYRPKTGLLRTKNSMSFLIKPQPEGSNQNHEKRLKKDLDITKTMANFEEILRNAMKQ